MRGALRGLDRALLRVAAGDDAVEEFIALYERLDLGGVLLGWDAQGKELYNGEIARICAQSGGRFVGSGSVDPNRSDALERLAAFPSLGLRGLKLHPTLQGFDPGDDRFLPFFDAAAELGLVCSRTRGRVGWARASRAGRACGSTSRGRSCSTASPPGTRGCRSCSRTSAGPGTSRPSRWRCTSPTSILDI